MAVSIPLGAGSRVELTPFLVAGALTVGAFGLLLVFGASTSWLGTPPETILDRQTGLALDPEYCEAIGPGFVRTVANSWSNLAYLASGLLAIALAQRAGRDAGGGSPTDRIFLAALYGGAVIVTGLFSFAFHASRTEFGKTLDVLGMYAWAAAVPAYVVGAWLQVAGSPSLSLVIALLTLVGGTALAAAMRFLAGLPSELGLVGLPAVGLVLQSIRIWHWPGRLVGSRPQGAPVSHGPWGYVALLVGLVTLGLAALIRGISMPSPGSNGAVAYSTLCDPGNAIFTPQNHLIQGHAIWHTLSATTFLLLFVFFRSERVATTA